MSAIKLIVGLGNPGERYLRTRHNVGAEWVRELAQDQGANFQSDKNCLGQVARLTHQDQRCYLLIPDAFMNLSGQSVSAGLCWCWCNRQRFRQFVCDCSRFGDSHGPDAHTVVHRQHVCVLAVGCVRFGHLVCQCFWRVYFGKLWLV